MADAAAKNPLRALMDVRRGEGPLAALMASYFFFVITTFWILKPLKKALFIQFYDKDGANVLGWQLEAAQAELIGKVLNMFAAIVAMTAFTLLSRRLVRQGLSYAFGSFFLACFAAYAWLVADPGPGTVWTFYLLGDLYSTVMVATFFAFLNDSVSPSAARRLYGVIVLGGVAGGVFGSTLVSSWIDDIGRDVWMWICLGIGILILLIAGAAGRLVKRLRADEPAEATSDEGIPDTPGNPALEGARLVLRSRYLLALVAIVGLYEIISTTLDFQFTTTVAHFLDGPAIGQHFSTVYMITNIASLVVQLLATSYIMSRFPLTIALILTPAAILGSSALYLAVPLLWPASLLSAADNSLSYSLNQSAREALYTATSREEKYKAKAFIDMFLQRFAKALAVGVSLGLTMAFKDYGSLRWLSIFVIVLIALWLLAARYAGRRFHELSAAAPSSEGRKPTDSAARAELA